MSFKKDIAESNNEDEIEASDREVIETVIEAENTTNLAKKLDEKEKSAYELKDKKKEEIVEERIYTVPLGKAWISPRKKTTPKAIRIIKNFIMRHMKVDSDSIKITNEVNEKIWSRGIEKPPRKIRIRAAKDMDGIVTVYHVEGG